MGMVIVEEGRRMMDLSQAGSVSGLAVLILLLVQVLKMVWPLTDAQKQWLPMLSILLGLVLGPLIGFVLGNVTDLLSLATWVFGGFLGGASAIGAYEVTIDKVKRLDVFQPDAF
jgi:ABC-type xylose transport system permease subunit